MRKQLFSSWLMKELTSSRMALLSILTQKDELLYQKAPQLRREYMDKIGRFEQEVLDVELECYLLRRKKEAIQTAINQRISVDIDKINDMLEAEKKQTLEQMENRDLTSSPLPQLTLEEKDEINDKYHHIVQDFHPAFNTDMSDTEKQLYTESLDAYKRNNLQAMTVIYDMLFKELPDEESNQLIPPIPVQQSYSVEQVKSDMRDISDYIASDYTLAKELYTNFIPAEEDTVFINATKGYIEQLNNIKAEVDTILKSFPFNAGDVLKDEAKTNAYLEELKLRKANSEIEKSELEKEIDILLKES